MEITDLQVTQYINGLYHPPAPFLEELRADAEQQNIPIILKETETLLLTLIEMKKPKHILEIGTAVGYSSLCFAFATQDCRITTIELQEKMQKTALKNILQAGFSDRIRILPGDAVSVLTKLLEERDNNKESVDYDFIFLDAAKGHYLEFWNLCVGLCAPHAVIVSDNILFKAMTAADEYLDVRRNKTIVNRMRAYLQHISSINGVQTTILPVGDGVAISVLK